MPADVSTTENLEGAVARSAGYGLIAHGFRYPDRAWLESFPDAFRRGAWAAPMAAIDTILAERMTAVRSALDTDGSDRLLENLQARFAEIFGHAVRGPCPAYELEYGSGEIIQRASDLADLAGFYAAFGLELAGPVSERPDHVCVEAEFMSVLTTKEAAGIRSANEAHLIMARDAGRKFLKGHLARWLPAFARRVMEADGDGFHGRLAGFADALIAHECLRLQIPQGSPYLELRPADPGDESTQSCGVPAACSVGPRFTQLNVCAADET